MKAPVSRRTTHSSGGGDKIPGALYFGFSKEIVRASYLLPGAPQPPVEIGDVAGSELDFPYPVGKFLAAGCSVLF